MIVIDSSVLVDALLTAGPDGDTCRAALAADIHWIAPPHFRTEFLSAVRGLERSGQISSEQALVTVDELSRSVIAVPDDAVLMTRIWELRHNLTSYDAACVALAEASGCALLTRDRRMAAAPGTRCPMIVL